MQNETKTATQPKQNPKDNGKPLSGSLLYRDHSSGKREKRLNYNIGIKITKHQSKQNYFDKYWTVNENKCFELNIHTVPVALQVSALKGSTFTYLSLEPVANSCPQGLQATQ